MSSGKSPEKEHIHVHRDAPAVYGIAAAIALIHMWTNNRYGFHRDELNSSAMLGIWTGDSSPIRP